MLYIKKHASDLVDEWDFDENQKLLASVLDYIVEINSKFNEKKIPFQLTLNFLKGGNLRAFAKVI